MTNIESHNAALGANSDPIQTAPSGQAAEGTNVPDAIDVDIDALFGSGDGLTSGGARKAGTQPAGDPNIPGQQTTTAPDPTKGMTPEQLAAHFQSIADKTVNRLSQIEPAYEKYKSVADFLNQVYEDPKVRRAFIAQLEPDLIKPIDPYDALQEQLKKEYGEEFVPDEDEASKPLTKSWRYLKRVDELYKDLSGKRNEMIPKTLEEIRNERKAAQEQAANEFERERLDTMNELKWSKTDWENFQAWAPKLKIKHLAKWYNHLQRAKGTAPNLVNQFGGTPTKNMPEFFQQLDNIFGK
jgi:hypothetical protein